MQQDDLTAEEFEAIQARALPVLAVATYGYARPDGTSRAAVAVWLEVDPEIPWQALLHRAMQRAAVEDECFVIHHSLTMDLPDSLTPLDTVPLFWGVTLEDGGKTAGRFSFPLLLPEFAAEVSCIAEEASVMICSIPKNTDLARNLRSQRPASGPLAIHFSDAETWLVVEGFGVDVPQPEVLESLLLAYYHRVGTEPDLRRHSGAGDDTGQTWQDILRSGDIHFSEAR